MKYLLGYHDDFEKKCENIGMELEEASTNEERAVKLCEIFGFDENTKAEELSILDIIPGVAELLLGIPSELFTKPFCQLTEEDGKLYDEAFNRVMTVFVNNNA